MTEAWDRDAFWYPTRDRRGLLLGIFLVLFALHFGELFGLATNDALVFGAFPIEYVYQLGMGVLHIGFLYLLYRCWPEPKDSVLEGGS